MVEKLSEFQGEPVSFVETVNVKEGVVCDVYHYTNTTEKDLAIVTVAPGSKTPLQKVLNGEKTIEGHISGEAQFVVTTIKNETTNHEYPGGPEVRVEIGEVMQWLATGQSSLVFYEICYPPYVDGRYENLSE